MPTKTEIGVPAANRAKRHRGLIAQQASPRAALRRAVEWLMSESRHIDTADVRVLTERITGIASEFNERSAQ